MDWFSVLLNGEKLYSLYLGIFGSSWMVDMYLENFFLNVIGLKSVMFCILFGNELNENLAWLQGIVFLNLCL